MFMHQANRAPRQRRPHWPRPAGRPPVPPQPPGAPAARQTRAGSAAPAHARLEALDHRRGRYDFKRRHISKTRATCTRSTGRRASRSQRKAVHLDDVEGCGAQRIALGHGPLAGREVVRQVLVRLRQPLLRDRHRVSQRHRVSVITVSCAAATCAPPPAAPTGAAQGFPEAQGLCITSMSSAAATCAPPPAAPAGDPHEVWTPQCPLTAAAS